jgi:hypothetical protein
VLFIVIAAGWCLLAFIGVAICRMAALSDDAHSLELADWVAAGGLLAREQPTADDPAELHLQRRGRAKRAIG